MIQGILSLVFFGIVFNFISSTDSGRVILYIFAIAGAFAILVNVKNSGKSIAGFLVSLTVATVVGFLVYNQFNSKPSCDGYYYAKKDTYGGARQSGITISSEKYGNICQYAGFQSACSAYNDCLTEPASHRPMVIFLNIVLILSLAFTLKLIPYNISSNGNGRSTKSNNNNVKSYEELSKIMPTTPTIINLDNERVNNDKDKLTADKSDVDLVPYDIKLFIDRTSEFSKECILKRNFANDFQEGKLRYWILKEINEDILALNKGFNAYCDLIINRTCNKGFSYEFHLNLAHACSYGFYKHGKTYFLPLYFYSHLENNEEITKFLIDKNRAIILLPIIFDSLTKEFGAKKRIKSNVVYFEKTWKSLIAGYFSSQRGVFASEIFNDEFVVFPSDQLSKMSNECRKILVEKFSKDISILDHWLQKIELA